MATWPGEILDICARAADGGPAAEAALADLVRQLVQWEADLAAAQQLRPFLWYWDVLAECYVQFREVAEHYLAALAAADPITAQREAQAAQEALDAANAAATEFEQRLARWNKVQDAGAEDEPTAVLAALLDAAAEERSGLSLLEPDSYADQLYERVTGARGCPITLAPGLRATEIQVDMIVDEDRFWECATRTYRRLTTTESNGQAAFDRLAAHQPWRSDLAEMQAELFEAGFELRQAMVMDRQRTQARGLIRFGHVLAERCAPTLIATLLAAYRDRDYEPLPSRGVGDLLSQAEDVDLDDLFYGVDRALRHSDAHGRLFEITDEGVHFSADRREYDFLTFPELLDRVLAGYESLVAVLLGVVCAAAEEGVAEELDPLLHLDISTADRARLVLTAAGLDVEQVTLEEDELSIRATAENETLRFSTIAMVAPFLQGDERMSVEIERAGTTKTRRGPAKPLVAFLERPGDLPDELATSKVLAAWSVDDTPLASSEQLQKLLAIVALRELTERDSHAERLRVVRAIARCARDTGTDAIAALLHDIENGLLRMMRGQPAQPSWQDTVEQLTSFASAAVPEISVAA